MIDGIIGYLGKAGIRFYDYGDQYWAVKLDVCNVLAIDVDIPKSYVSGRPVKVNTPIRRGAAYELVNELGIYWCLEHTRLAVIKPFREWSASLLTSIWPSDNLCNYFP